MGYHGQIVSRPALSPAEITLVQRAYSGSIAASGFTASDPRADRLAALAIHLYQTGMQDEDQLRRALIGACVDAA